MGYRGDDDQGLPDPTGKVRKFPSFPWIPIVCDHSWQPLKHPFVALTSLLPHPSDELNNYGFLLDLSHRGVKWKGDEQGRKEGQSQRHHPPTL
jgi:hypothetical protein